MGPQRTWFRKTRNEGRLPLTLLPKTYTLDYLLVYNLSVTDPKTISVVSKKKLQKLNESTVL